MNKRKRVRLLWITGIFLMASIGVYLILANLENNIVFFYPPSKLSGLTFTNHSKIRVGGLVKEGSITVLAPNKVRFIITDHRQDLIIEYTGILPALFREKQGIVAEGILIDGIFITTRLLAKHDENYMPPEIEQGNLEKNSNK